MLLPAPLPLLLLPFLLLLLLYTTLKYLQYARLRAFPGPFSTGWSEIWHTRAILSMRSHVRYKEVTDKYGPIARIGPNELLTSSAPLLTHMSAVRSGYTRGAWFNRATRMQPGQDHVFSQLDEGRHAKRRQQMASGYSGKENHALESAIDGRVEELLDLIRSKYLSTSTKATPMDLARKIQYFALDVISTIGFGQAFGDLKADADLNDYIVSSEQGLAIVTLSGALGLTPILQWPPVARLLGPSEKDKSGFGRMMGTARKLIDARLDQPTDKRSDMLASFMRHGLSREELFTEALLQILAGSDTTATALRGIMLYVLANPRVYAKLQAEIDDVVSSGASSASSVVSEATLRNMPYLQAVVREGLRIRPPVTDAVPKLVPKGGDTVVIDGETVFLPGGTNISYCAWGVHRNKQVFGDDADQFLPERWLLNEEDEHDRERLAAMKRTTELIFGYGKYQCLGKPVAWMEITKTLFEFLRHFDWSLATPEKPWRETNYMGIFCGDDMWVLVHDRGVRG
ncbi:benzoate 4-monooxygenase cytochrome-like protein P450 [Massariosphaeria phaeospora]|uniref:Cytochrome P450 monooxygenase ABA1 n=1 Tax=Massariosphaeria phaeospora TaxID=100035 RepID=A0A7C8M4S0_9PLEO|nr:benzoate 4-monooxygenase cytochrome-like protein P450 [Massariosphaeria phaeospora]